MCEDDNYIISLHTHIKTNFLDVCLSKLCSILFLNVLFPQPPPAHTREDFYVLSPLTLKACTKIYQWPLSPNILLKTFVLSHENRMNYDIKACGLSEGLTRLEEGS